MKLHKDCAQEYKKRHDEVWPDLAKMLNRAGIRDYSIFLDQETNILFAILKIIDTKELETLPALAVMQEWWKYMSDIMETNPDHSPIVSELTEMFYLS